MEIKDLNLSGIIAFDGSTRNGLQLHPDQEHILYPMGNKITIKNMESGDQHFLSGHTNLITALCISSCGKYVASGQMNYLGFKTTVIIWNYYERSIKGKHEIHKVKVQDICFSCDGNFLVSLGGRDDGNLVIWDVKVGSPICGSVASSGISGKTNVVTRTNSRDLSFVSAGENIVKVWKIDPRTRKLRGVEVKVGKLKRCVTSVVVSDDDQHAFCGTTSGDIIKIRLNLDSEFSETAEPSKIPLMVDCYSKISKNPRNQKIGIGELYGGGVQNLLLSGNKLIVGAGDGTIELVEILPEVPRVHKSISKSHSAATTVVKSPNKALIKTLLSENVNSAVSSLVMLRKDYILVGTTACEIYRAKLSNFDTRLTVTCHTDTIHDIAFPSNYSAIFVTCGKNDIRLWRTETQKELLRITVPNFVCSSVCFSWDGAMIVSAWNDSTIRAFTPQTGRLIFAIDKAHLSSVSAVAITKNGKKIISGGCDAQVRIWDVRADYQHLEAVLKEHRGPITNLHISSDDECAVSSSTDGTCIIWDIEKQVRRQMLRANTMFMGAQICPNLVQVLTCGSDKKVSYWEILDGSVIRELEASKVGTVNCIDVTPDCKHFVTGANDFIVKCWDYEIGDETHVGVGHAAYVTACKFSPDGKKIVTASADGTIIIWDCPFEVESGSSSRSLSKKLGDENVSAMSSPLQKNLIDSVRSLHEGDLSCSLCRCDPSKPSQNVCSHKEEAAGL